MKWNLACLSNAAGTVSRLLTLHSGTGMVFNFSDVLNRHRHKANAQSKNNIVCLC